MRKEKLLRQMIPVLTALILVFALISYRPDISFADSGKDYVIIIDVSTSMQDIFDEVKRLSKRAISQAAAGDNVAVITFGEHATLLARKQIRGKSDVETLKKQVDQLYPTDYVTYINSGLERGLSELRYLFEKNPDRDRVMLWLSDDKDNPPEALGEDFITLDKLRENNKSFEPGSEWFDYVDPLSEARSQNLEDFVTWARRTTFRVAIKNKDIDLGSFEDRNVKKSVVLTFEPRHPGAEGLQFNAVARLVNRNDPSQTILVNLSPQRVRASGHLWKQKFDIDFEADPGEYSGVLSFHPVAGAALDVEPRAISFTAMIVPPKLESEEEPEEEPEPIGLLASAKKQGIIATEDRPPGLTRPAKPLGFASLAPGKKVSKIITLFLNKEADAKSITHDQSIELPPGVDIESKVFGGGTKLAAEITIVVDKNVQLPETFQLDIAYEGNLRFKSSEPDVQVLPINIPIRLTFDTDRMRWGRKMLPQTGVGQVKARRMTFEELTKQLEEGKQATQKTDGSIISALKEAFSTTTSRYILLPALAALLVVMLILLYNMRPASEMFAGELVVIKDPSGSDMKDVNLKRIGSLHDKNVLTLGSSPKADIRLNHESVLPLHCKISAKTTQHLTNIMIHPLKGNFIKINDIEKAEKTSISDKDLIGIGEFILLFSNPETQKEVVARFIDGRTMRGIPVTWDIAAASFELLRVDAGDTGGTAEEITVVNFSELKAIFFLEEDAASKPSIPSEMINTEELLEISFSDGEKIEGHPLNDYSDVSRRFYLVPKEMPNVGSVLIERASVDEVTRREAPTESEPAKTAGPLAFFRKRKGAAPAE